MKAWDVIVIGAGPAGSASAASCAARGLRTLLVEKGVFPREKVCGCCLNEAAIEVIEALGAGGALRELGGKGLHAMELHAGRRSLVMPLRRGMAVSRAALDAMLAGHASRVGACMNMGTGAEVRERVDGLWSVELGRGEASEVQRTRAVVIADGLNGRSLRGLPGWGWRVPRRSRMGLGCRLQGLCAVPEGVIRMAAGREGYVGLVRLEDGSIELGASVDPAALKASASPGALVERILRGSGIDVPGDLDGAHLRGTALLTRSRERVESEGIFVVGDAAGYVEPVTGEGISWALGMGSGVGAHIERFAGGGYSAGAWASAVDRMVRGRRHRCAVVATALRHPAALGLVMEALGWLPGLPGAIGRAFGSRLPTQVRAGLGAAGAAA